MIADHSATMDRNDPAKLQAFGFSGLGICWSGGVGCAQSGVLVVKAFVQGLSIRVVIKFT